MKFFKVMIMKLLFLIVFVIAITACDTESETRERISLNGGWKFFKYSSIDEADNLIYDVRPETDEDLDQREADAEPEDAQALIVKQQVLKPWILPTGNRFLKDTSKWHVRPDGNPGGDFLFVQNDFDDGLWQDVNLPHDWATAGPFIEGWDPLIGGSMGRLPSPGVAWYRRTIDISEADFGKSIFLDIDGAMSYAMVWLNGNLVGGWPYGYSSWRVDLTPYIVPGGENQLAIRLDNPPVSSRWYPGAGLYRNVWLTKTNPIHVVQWGTFITARDISESAATIDMEVEIDNKSDQQANVKLETKFYLLDSKGKKAGNAVAQISSVETLISAQGTSKIKGSVKISNPKLWGPLPTQTPNLYVAVTKLSKDGVPVDVYETQFGIRSLEFDPENGLHVNGEPIYIKGVNQHHDLGALGAAFNMRAAERQLEILKDAGVNSIRMAHNPPAPELLALTDRMGFLVVNEIFDVWERRKAPLDFHLVFPDWHEQDLRALIRRDRNSPSVIMWSFGNEVGEQYTGEDGAAVAQRLNDIIKEEDTTRPTTASMNFAKPNMPMPATMDIISLNYQGEGIRIHPGYEHLQGIRTHPLYPEFHEVFPEKMIISSENAAALSTRGEYLFPVTEYVSAPVSTGIGGDPTNQIVCSYELYTANFGSSADRVFAAKIQHPFVAGGFVWSGFDYLGEPTPYYGARSTYFGLVDLAGFKKNRFYLYQAFWRPDYPMVHILPHWNWPERIGEVTPVHVFTSGDEAELFLNGKSLGRKQKGDLEYRLRWDDVVFEPGVLKVVAYKNGEEWATQTVQTTDEPFKLVATADRDVISADGYDLSFITISVKDRNGIMVPNSKPLIQFEIEGPAEIIATDNGDPTDMTAFTSLDRFAFNGLALVIVRSHKGEAGAITVTAKSSGLVLSSITIKSQK
jgi:beta-galactosidase